jgi:hypothetical protein
VWFRESSQEIKEEEGNELKLGSADEGEGVNWEGRTAFGMT